MFDYHYLKEPKLDHTEPQLNLFELFHLQSLRVTINKI